MAAVAVECQADHVGFNLFELADMAPVSDCGYAKRHAILNTLELKDKAKASAMLSLPDARHPV